MERTREDADRFRRAVTRIEPLDQSALDAAFARAQVRCLSKGDHFLCAGEPAVHIAFVVRGLLREYFLLSSGDERTKAFVVEGQISGSLADLLSEAPSKAHIVADEPTRLLTIPLSTFEALAEKYEDWRRFRRSATEALMLRKAEREYELLALDADARYSAFKDQYPKLEARVAARHIASYLGITPVYLSRLRRRRATRSSQSPK